jgi:hypothetical protein
MITKDLVTDPKALYVELQKAGMEIGPKGSLFPELHKVEMSESGSQSSSSRATNTILKEYLEYLNGKKQCKIDPAFLATAPEFLSKLDKKAIIVIDEAQSFLPFEVEAIAKSLPQGSVLYLCRDGNQSLEDPFDLTGQKMFDLTGKKPSPFNFNILYRTPVAVTELANKILEVKLDIVRKGSKKDMKSGDSPDKFIGAKEEGGVNNGYVEWVDSNDVPHSGPSSSRSKPDNIVENLSKLSEDIINSIIVVFSDAGKSAAEKQFPKSIILTPKEASGLEYKHIILFDAFGSQSPLGSLNIAKLSDQSENHMDFIIPFNELFVAITRATEGVSFFTPQLQEQYSGKQKSKGKNSSSKEFFDKALKESLSTNTIITEKKIIERKLSIKELMKHIEERHQEFLPQVLCKYLKHFTNMLNAPENSSVIKSQIGEIDQFVRQMHNILNDASKKDAHVEQSLVSLTEAIGRIEKNIQAEQAHKKASEVQAQGTVSVAHDKKAVQKSSPLLTVNEKPINSTTPTKQKPTSSSTKTHNSKVAKDTEKVGKAKIAFDVCRTLIEQMDLEHLLQKINTLIETIGNINYQGGPEGSTLLHIAAEKGRLRVIEYLLKAGAKIDGQMQNGATALHIAAQDNHLEVVKHLLNAGAKINLQMEDGSTARRIAAENEHLEVLQCLLNAGAKVKKRIDDDSTALFIAARKGNLEGVKYLLSHGADVNSITETEWWLLKWAYADEYKIVSEYLRPCIADKNNGVIEQVVVSEPESTLSSDREVSLTGSDQVEYPDP